MAYILHTTNNSIAIKYVTATGHNKVSLKAVKAVNILLMELCRTPTMLKCVNIHTTDMSFTCGPVSGFCGPVGLYVKVLNG